MSINLFLEFPHSSVKQRSDIERKLAQIKDASENLTLSITQETALRNLQHATEDALDEMIQKSCDISKERTKLLDELSDLYKVVYQQELRVSSNNHEDVQTQNLKNAMDGTTPEPLGHN